jgi:phosphoglycolate phosphatase-like HAD superfamily hydrolase
MIVFDVDGTLIGGEAADWASFDAALLEVLGFEPDPEFFTRNQEVTAQAIVHQLIAEHSPEKNSAERKSAERAVAAAYLRNLKHAHAQFASAFSPAAGALALLRHLKDEGIPFALATGDWRESISFKLTAAGIPFGDIPMATSSEYHSRADIIAAAVAQANQPLSAAIYVGDGLWDLRACARLGIPFIGVGSNRARLSAAGATYTTADLQPAKFLSLRKTIAWPEAKPASA